MDVWKKLSENSGGEDTDLKVENFIVVHDHVNRPAELLPVGLGVHLQVNVWKFYRQNIKRSFLRLRKKSPDLLNRDLMGLAPLHADSWIQVVQLAGAQGNGLRGISYAHVAKRV